MNMCDVVKVWVMVNKWVNVSGGVDFVMWCVYGEVCDGCGLMMND